MEERNSIPPGAPTGQSRTFEAGEATCASNEPDEQNTSSVSQGMAQDAARYRWLREQDWFDGVLCVVRDPKKVLTRGSGLGADCPSRDRLDAAIDAAMLPQPTGERE